MGGGLGAAVGWRSHVVVVRACRVDEDPVGQASLLDQVLEDALEDVYAGRTVGISFIAYRKDWTFRISNAGSILHVPAFGIAAAHVLASDMEQRLRALGRS